MFDHFNNPPHVEAANPPSPQMKVLRFDKDYVKSMPGMLKLSQLLFNIIGFICIKFSSTLISGIFYNLMYWVANIVTLFLFVMYMFHFVEKYDGLPWAKYEFFYCCIVVATYIVCSIIATTVAENIGFVVAFVGFCAVLAYSFDGYLKYKSWRSGLPAQSK